MGLKDSLDRANLNTIADSFRTIKLGQTMRQDYKTTLRAVDPDTVGANVYDPATADSIVLPDDVRAGTILRAFARVGTAAVGALTIAARHTTPSTTEVGISPAGNILFLETDAYTDVDVEFMPERGDVVEMTLPVVPGTGVLTLPASISGKALVLIEAESLVGTVVSTMFVLTPAAAAPATTNALLSIDGTLVYFAVADAVTSARVKLLVNAAADINALLESSAAEYL